MKSLIDKALQAAITMVVVVVLLRWSWTLVRPLVPLLLVAAGLFLLGRVVLTRYRRF